MANEYETTRNSGGRFGAGNPGRPPGARNHVTGRVAGAILDDFEAHQDEVMARLRESYTGAYLRAVTGLLPRLPAPPEEPELFWLRPDEWTERDRRETFATIKRILAVETDQLKALSQIYDKVLKLWSVD